MDQFTDMETWLHDNADERIFRVWRYKKVFTPREQDAKYIDESIYEDEFATYCWLSEVVELGNGRIMFGFKNAIACLSYEHGNRESEPPVEYMLDGEFKMEYHPGDLEQLSEDLGYGEDDDVSEPGDE